MAQAQTWELSGRRLPGSPSLTMTDKCAFKKNNNNKGKKKRRKKKKRKTSKPSINSPCAGRVAIMPFSTPRLFARERIRRLGKGARVAEVYLSPFREKDYRHKTVCHLGEAGVLRFSCEALGMPGRKPLCSD